MTGAEALLVLGEVLAAPSDGGEMNSVTVSPGLPGFFAAFVLAVVVVLLAVDLSRRTRRIQARARVEERMREEQERAAAEQSPSAEVSSSAEETEPRAEEPAADLRPSADEPEPRAEEPPSAPEDPQR